MGGLGLSELALPVHSQPSNPNYATPIELANNPYQALARV
jgi:hypothetical protein